MLTRSRRTSKSDEMCFEKLHRNYIRINFDVFINFGSFNSILCANSWFGWEFNGALSVKIFRTRLLPLRISQRLYSNIMAIVKTNRHEKLRVISKLKYLCTTKFLDDSNFPIINWKQTSVRPVISINTDDTDNNESFYIRKTASN